MLTEEQQALGRLFARFQIQTDESLRKFATVIIDRVNKNKFNKSKCIANVNVMCSTFTSASYILHGKYTRPRFQLNIHIQQSAAFEKCFVCFGCLYQVAIFLFTIFFLLEFNRCFVFACSLALGLALCVFVSPQKWLIYSITEIYWFVFDFFIFQR